MLLPKAQSLGQALQYLCNHAHCAAENLIPVDLMRFFTRECSYDKGHIAGSAGEIQDLGVLICDALQQELFHQSLGVTVTHDRLALVEVLQVLHNKKSSSHAWNFFLSKCYRWPMIKELRPVLGVGGGAEDVHHHEVLDVVLLPPWLLQLVNIVPKI